MIMANGHTTNKKNEVTTTKEKVSEITKLGDFDYSAYAGQGFESHTRDDYAVPFLGVLQSNSPLCETAATARPGMLVNTVTQDIYDGKTGIYFIPAHTDHVVVEWKPRNLGGGFVAIHQLNSELIGKVKAEQEFGKWKTIKGDEKSNDLIETFYVYGIHVNEHGAAEQMIMSFSSTKIKTYKRWMTKARTVQVALPDGRRINPPLFAHKYKVTTVAEKNAKGSFFNFNIDFDGSAAEKCRLPTTDPLFLAAVAFSDLIREGSVKAAHDTQTQTSEIEAAGDDIPFS
jgi:hypothetical protein